MGLRVTTAQQPEAGCNVYLIDILAMEAWKMEGLKEMPFVAGRRFWIRRAVRSQLLPDLTLFP